MMRALALFKVITGERLSGNFGFPPIHLKLIGGKRENSRNESWKNKNEVTTIPIKYDWKARG